MRLSLLKQHKIVDLLLSSSNPDNFTLTTNFKTMYAIAASEAVVDCYQHRLSTSTADMVSSRL